MIKSISLFGKELIRVERNRLGQYTYSFLDGQEFVDAEKYLELSLKNPVLFTIVSLRSKLYSQMEIKHVNEKGEIIENSPYVKLLNTPNFFQSKEDFFFQQMWFLSTAGTNLVYQQKAFTNDVPKAIYNLIPSELDWKQVNKLDKFIITEQEKKKFGEKTIEYKLNNTTYNLKLSDLTPLYDLGNSLVANSPLISQSRVKAIAKVLNNIEQNLNSKNKNLQFSAKYIGKNTSTGNEAQIQPSDRESIERVLSKKDVLTTNANIEYKHLVSDLKRLYLDEQFADDANKCLLAYEMNKDVLNYFATDSTFENQVNGMINYIGNSIQQSANNTLNSLSQQWGLMEKGEKLIASFDHLPAMKTVINQKLSTFMEMQNAIKLGLENGTITDVEAKEMSDKLKIKLGL